MSVLFMYNTKLSPGLEIMKSKIFCYLSRRNQSTTSPRSCLHAQTILTNWMLLHYLKGHQMWRTKESMRILLNRLLPRLQVCVSVYCQLNIQPFTYEILIHPNVFLYSDWERLWRPGLWPEGSSNLRLWRRYDTFSILHFLTFLTHLSTNNFVSFSTQRLMMRSPSTRMTSSPTSRWLTRAGGRDSVADALAFSRPLMFSCSERRARGVLAQASLLHNLRLFNRGHFILALY